jgi:8-oxo-dGTP diphosphatase
LIREIREELTLEATPRRKLGVVEHQREDARLWLVAFCTDVSSGPPSLLDHEEIAWVPAEELLDYDLAPADVEIARWVASGACKD